MASGTEQLKQQIEEIEPFEAQAEIEAGNVVLIDTREPHEYQEAHLEGGKLVPPGLLGEEIAAAAPDKSARTILYCRSGNRSAIAAAQLEALGYENVASVAGGILLWQEQGLPVVSASDARILASCAADAGRDPRANESPAYDAYSARAA